MKSPMESVFLEEGTARSKPMDAYRGRTRGSMGGRDEITHGFREGRVCSEWSGKSLESWSKTVTRSD